MLSCDSKGPSPDDGGEIAIDGGGLDGGASVDGGVRFDGGGFPTLDGGSGDGGFLPPEVIEVEVQSMEPTRGPASGGTLLTIAGRGFIPGTQVTVGGQAVVDLVIAGERRITAKTPP